MTVRRLTGDDAATWQALRLTALREAPSAFLTTLQEAEAHRLDDVARRIDAALTFGAFDGDALVGMLTVVPLTGASVAHRATVVAVFVARSHRRHGVARDLLLAAEGAARENGLLQLELAVEATNAPAIAFYTRHGFRRTGLMPRAVLRDGVFQDDIAMVRDLDA